MGNPNLLNAKETAEFLRVSPYTVRLWTYQRRFPVVKLGRRALYRRADLDVFIEHNLRPSRENDNAGH